MKVMFSSGNCKWYKLLINYGLKIKSSKTKHVQNGVKFRNKQYKHVFIISRCRNNSTMKSCGFGCTKQTLISLNVMYIVSSHVYTQHQKIRISLSIIYFKFRQTESRLNRV